MKWQLLLKPVSAKNPADMPEIHLLRHGQASGGDYYRGSTDDPLSELGWQQMWNAVAKQKWDAVISSPLQRCASFAKSYCDKNQLPFKIDNDLREYHFGEWEGKSSKTLFEQSPDDISRFWQNPFQFTPPGAESLYHFEHRILNCWQRIQENTQFNRLLIITHGGVIKTILRRIHNLPPEKFFSIQVPLACLISSIEFHSATCNE